MEYNYALNEKWNPVIYGIGIGSGIFLSFIIISLIFYIIGFILISVTGVNKKSV
jgi:hypothetical protein